MLFRSLSDPVRACPCPCPYPPGFRGIVGLVVDATLRTVPDRLRTRRTAAGFFCAAVDADAELPARCGMLTSASSEAVALALAPSDDSGAGNTSSRTPYCCGARRLAWAEPKNSSYSPPGSDEGDGVALCTSDWRRRTKRECASEREDNRMIARRMADSSPPCASLLSNTIDCIG